jgi:formylmethanofuran dehydrogenase subunit E
MTTICGHSTNAYLAMVEQFHGNPAPGLLIGGFIVDMAMKNRPAGEFFDVLCETSVCLPDAVQLLTPCTYGNGWLKVVDIGRFAITVFEKYSGKGVRVHLDASKLGDYPEIRNWFFRLKSKEQQDREKLQREILEAGTKILTASGVQVDGKHVGKKKGGATAICPKCGEAYPVKTGETCLACQGEVLYK